MKSLLGVNIDHIATLRQARRECYPDPVQAAILAEKNGADSIVAHLREDRRHIQDKDVYALKKKVKTRFNLEMSLAPEIVRIALKTNPAQVTLVPERRQELTTEGGLDLFKTYKRCVKAIEQFHYKNIVVNLFIAPQKKQVKLAQDLGVKAIELHTGHYASAGTRLAQKKELSKIKSMVEFGLSLGLEVNVGHGLHYNNIKPIAAIKGIHEFNIGHGIIAHAAFVGLPKAVREMKRLIRNAK